MIGRVTLIAAAGVAAAETAGAGAAAAADLPWANLAGQLTGLGFVLWYAYFLTAKVLPKERERGDQQAAEFLAELRAEREARAADRRAFKCAAIAAPDTSHNR